MPGFTIPNASAAAFPSQAEPDSVDFDVLISGFARTGVISGCATTAQGSPDMTVAVALGAVQVLGVDAAVTAGNLAVSAAHATLNRLDLVVVSSAGAKSVVAGAVASRPVFPAIPAASVVISSIYVPAAAVVVNSNQITDKRTILSATPALNSAVVHLAGAETLSGAKTGVRWSVAIPSAAVTGDFFGVQATFAGDPVFVDNQLVHGLNVGSTPGAPADSSRASWWEQFEDQFRNSPASPYVVEWHLNFIPPGGDAGDVRRPLGVWCEHVALRDYIFLAGRLAIDSTVPAAGGAPVVFDMDTDLAIRANQGAWHEITTAVGATTATMIAVQRASGDGANPAHLEDRQILRVSANGNLGFGTWQQFGSGVGVIGVRNAGTVPSTSPALGHVYYSEAGVAKWKGSDGQVDSIRTAQPPRFKFRSTIDGAPDAGVAGIGQREYVAFYVEEQNAKIDRVLFEVTTSSGTLEVAIMDDDGAGGGPGTRLSTSGTVACPAVGKVAVAVPEITGVAPGLYYAALSTVTGAAQFRYVSGVSSALGAVRYNAAGTTIPNPETAASADTSGNVYVVRAGHS